MMERQELREKWIAALRSGKYQQAREVLRQFERDNGGGILSNDPIGYCCLGVLCDVIDPDDWDWDHYHGQDSYLPADVWETIGLRSESGSLYFDDGTRVARIDGELTIVHVSDYSLFEWERITKANSLAGMNDVLEATFDEIADFIESHPDLVWVDG